MGQILSYPADTSPATGDKFLFQDGSSNATKHMTYGTLKDSIAGAAWTSYTPTFANTTLGNGTVTGAYVQIGKTTVVRASFVLGSTSAVASNPTVSVPVNISSSHVTNSPVGTCISLNSGVNTCPGVVQMSGAAAVLPTILVTDSTYGYHSGLAATVPFAWGTSDAIYVFLVYEAA